MDGNEPPRPPRSFTLPRDPRNTHAYLIGDGIAALAAAVYLLQDAKVPGGQIHVLGSALRAEGLGEVHEGDFCMSELLRRIPSVVVPGGNLYDEDGMGGARWVGELDAGMRLLGLSEEDVEGLVEVMLDSEGDLGTKKIEECFRREFFETRFWQIWATIFASHSSDSAVTFKHHFHLLTHELSHINTHPTHPTITQSLTAYLTSNNVDLRPHTPVTALDFIPGIPDTVSTLRMLDNTSTAPAAARPVFANLDAVNDVVFITLGSAAVSLPRSPELPGDGTCGVWRQLALRDAGRYGDPGDFHGRVEESGWVRFVVRTSTSDLRDQILRCSGRNPETSTGALITLKDSSWLLTVLIPPQPQPSSSVGAEPTALRGWATTPHKPGDFIAKPMRMCSGEEVLTELLSHFNIPLHPFLEQSAVQLASVPFLPSPRRGRPKVVPEGTTNIALLGPWVDVGGEEEDGGGDRCVVESCVRSARVAVARLMGGDVLEVQGGEREGCGRLVRRALGVLEMLAEVSGEGVGEGAGEGAGEGV